MRSKVAKSRSSKNLRKSKNRVGSKRRIRTLGNKKSKRIRRKTRSKRGGMFRMFSSTCNGKKYLEGEELINYHLSLFKGSHETYKSFIKNFLEKNKIKLPCAKSIYDRIQEYKKEIKNPIRKEISQIDNQIRKIEHEIMMKAYPPKSKEEEEREELRKSALRNQIEELKSKKEELKKSLSIPTLTNEKNLRSALIDEENNFKNGFGFGGFNLKQILDDLKPLLDDLKPSDTPKFFIANEDTIDKYYSSSFSYPDVKILKSDGTEEPFNMYGFEKFQPDTSSFMGYVLIRKKVIRADTYSIRI